MATQQRYRRAWVGFFLLAVLIVLCSGCAKNAGPDRLTRESDNPIPCLMDAPETTPAAPVGTWTVPDEWSVERGEGGTLMGYREPTDNSVPPTETAAEQPWTPQPMGDGEDSYCYTVTYSTADEQQCTPEPMGDGDDSGCNAVTGSTDEGEYRQTILDTLNTELEEQMQAVPETPNTETDEASGLVGAEGPDYRNEMPPSSLTEDQDTISPTGRTNDGNNDPAVGSSP
jgi:hypothetical protein